MFGEYNRELYEDYGLFGYGGYSQKNQDELSRNIERQLQTALGQQDKAASSANIDLYRIHEHFLHNCGHKEVWQTARSCIVRLSCI